MTNRFKRYSELKAEFLERTACGAEAWSGNDFESFALRVFDFQLNANDVYRNCCLAIHNGAEIASWRDIPHLPTSAFKRSRVLSLPEEVAPHYFQTSGTTEAQSGRHYFESFSLYEAALGGAFGKYMGLSMSDEKFALLMLMPSPDEAPRSSLSHMMETLRGEIGNDTSGFFMSAGRLDFESLVQSIEAVAGSQSRVIVAGTGFGLVHLLDELDKQNFSLALPAGSRIMETGGFKGRSREIPRKIFYPQLAAAFNIPLHCIVNEYGMTELSSQFYDVSIIEGQSSEWKEGPPWAKVRAVNPMTGSPLPDGEQGLLRITDLANLASVCFLQTEDVGVCEGNRFKVLGRIGGAVARGCSIGAEDMLRRRS